MAQTLIDIEASVWTDVLADTRIDLGDTVVVSGFGAAQVAQAILRLGGPPPVAGDDAIVVCSHSQVPDVVDGVPQIAPGSASSAVVVHAWDGRAELDDVANDAARWVGPGGAVVLADLDALRVVSSSTLVYPSAGLYQRHADIAEYLVSRSVTNPELSMAAVRAGLEDPVLIEFDRPVGVFDDLESHRAAVAFGAWRGLEQLGDAAYDEVVSLVSDRFVRDWPLVEWEPWIAVGGRVRF